jgi:4-amino-4-deoxy-L-arabinose transferase-like glycosyltransferase
VAFAFIIAIQLGRSAAYASLAALISGLSPEVLKNSHIVGVDVLMAFLCLACTSIGIPKAE